MGGPAAFADTIAGQPSTRSLVWLHWQQIRQFFRSHSVCLNGHLEAVPQRARTARICAGVPAAATSPPTEASISSLMKALGGDCGAVPGGLLKQGVARGCSSLPLAHFHVSGATGWCLARLRTAQATAAHAAQLIFFKLEDDAQNQLMVSRSTAWTSSPASDSPDPASRDRRRPSTGANGLLPSTSRRCAPWDGRDTSPVRSSVNTWNVG